MAIVVYCNGSVNAVMTGAPYQIKMRQNRSEAADWCDEQFGVTKLMMYAPNDWKSINDKWALAFLGDYTWLFGFANEEDYMKFCLRWQ